MWELYIEMRQKEKLGGNLENLDITDDGVHVKTLVADAIYGRKQREFLDHISCRQEHIDLLGRKGALQLLAVQQLRFKDLDRLAGLCERLGNLAIATANAGSQQVSDTARI